MPAPRIPERTTCAGRSQAPPGIALIDPAEQRGCGLVGDHVEQPRRATAAGQVHDAGHETRRSDRGGGLKRRLVHPERGDTGEPVGSLRVPEESPDDPGTLLEALQGIEGDCLELVSGQRHGPRDPVVLDILVDPLGPVLNQVS